ncbi:MAG TPA: choice-of-anchor Q domain-containing protein [Rhodanobacteraceae bacterium]|jgi:hypothetical protein|nr:choice-of-anchor Q domain-containing protein [Rhodanobacteraceae bacterium]
MDVVRSHGRLRASFPNTKRLRTLALCVSAALASPATIRHAGAAPNPPWVVKNCTDHDTDSLRDIVLNKAQSGDTVDLRQLPVLCETANSTITLSSGEITVHQNDLLLQGPTTGAVTISGGGASRVFAHDGHGQLSISSLSIANGYSALDGGCIYSKHDVSLTQARVTGCISSGNGGGIYASNEVDLIGSVVSGNMAKQATRGGGIFADSLVSKYSSITGNVSNRGGGARTFIYAKILASTIDDNIGGGLYADGETRIYNSTFSGNVHDGDGSAVKFRAGDAVIANSTIAFNQSGFGYAVSFQNASYHATLRSSIVAENTMGANHAPGDLYIESGVFVSGADNLVVASNANPPGVISVSADPKLGPLQFNGGPTRTHELLADSPALGKGNMDGLPATTINDQRGPGYPRKSGMNIDIGAVQFDTIFVDDFQ